MAFVSSYSQNTSIACNFVHLNQERRHKFLFLKMVVTFDFKNIAIFLLLFIALIMSKFLIYRREIETAINNCLHAASDYRKNNSVDEVPAAVIQDFVNQYITPLGGKENRLNIPLPEGGKQDWRRNATELVFRRTLLHIVVSCHYIRLISNCNSTL